MNSANIDVDRKARRMEDHLPPNLSRAVRHLADVSGWSVRHVMLALLVNAIAEQAAMHSDTSLGLMVDDCIFEMQAVIAESDPMHWLHKVTP